MQKLILQTIVGPKEIGAPDGWEFDNTATIAWVHLLTLTRRLKQPFRTKRDEFVVGGQRYILCLVLSNALGMAVPYWEREAQEEVDREDSRCRARNNSH